MATTNKNYDKLAAGYLFPEIAKRTNAFLQKNPGTEVMRLGIGNTTEPLTHTIIRGLQIGVEKLASVDTYSGYGDEQGDKRLRKALADRYEKMGVKLEPEEIFVSDGAKPDSANIQSIFSEDSIVAVQDPAYPVYVDSNVIAGRAGKFVNGKYDNLFYMPCTETNNFIPDPPEMIRGKADLIYLCSPNNPTGAVATKKQLSVFVEYAHLHEAVIIFDAAYSAYISDPELPKSIYEVEGAKECAIEISSFSKDVGFTGVRLGWTVVPKTIVTAGEDPAKLNSLWNRRQTTMFNGASNIVQEGGLAALTEVGHRECQSLVNYYMENARTIKAGLEQRGLKVYGGTNAPYIWVKTPNGMKSWEFFDKLLNEAHVVCTPGAGFGPSGEGYVRFSAFGHRENVEKAIKSIQDSFTL